MTWPSLVLFCTINFEFDQDLSSTMLFTSHGSLSEKISDLKMLSIETVTWQSSRVVAN